MKRQKQWLEVTEQRVGITTTLISAMKSVKMLGLIERMHSKIRKLRHEEVRRAKKVRVFYAIFTILQTLSLSGTRWITYTVFGIITLLSSSNSDFGANRLFTSLAILNIFMERLEIFLRQMPALASSFGCLRRIEVFLLLEMKRDTRLVDNVEQFGSETAGDSEFQDFSTHHSLIQIKDLSVGWTEENAVFQGLSMDMTRGSFTMIIGP
jgi:ATP-binding cassette subfamily C (CFTR/MRP) protein 1